MTNGDRIRKMSDVELAGFIDKIEECEMCAYESWEERFHCGECKAGVLKWLQQEAKE